VAGGAEIDLLRDSIQAVEEVFDGFFQEKLIVTERKIYTQDELGSLKDAELLSILKNDWGISAENKILVWGAIDKSEKEIGDFYHFIEVKAITTNRLIEYPIEVMYPISQNGVFISPKEGKRIYRLYESLVAKSFFRSELILAPLHEREKHNNPLELDVKDGSIEKLTELPGINLDEIVIENLNSYISQRVYDFYVQKNKDALEKNHSEFSEALEWEKQELNNAKSIIEDDVNKANAEIIIMDLYGKVIEKAYTNEAEVPGMGRAELSAQIDPSNLMPGVYRVIAKVTYDGFVTTAENTFYIKDFLLIPLDISVRDFTLGEIAKFNILVENIGNVDVRDAYSLMLLDKEGENVANLKSVPIDFKPFEKKEMVSYWDTKDVKADEYDGRLLLRYDDKTDEKKIKTIVGKNSINTEIIGITGYAINKEERGSPISGSPLVILIVLLVMVNVGWFVFYFLSRKKK